MESFDVDELLSEIGAISIPTMCLQDVSGFDEINKMLYSVQEKLVSVRSFFLGLGLIETRTVDCGILCNHLKEVKKALNDQMQQGAAGSSTYSQVLPPQSSARQDIHKVFATSLRRALSILNTVEKDILDKSGQEQLYIDDLNIEHPIKPAGAALFSLTPAGAVLSGEAHSMEYPFFHSLSSSHRRSSPLIFLFPSQLADQAHPIVSFLTSTAINLLRTVAIVGEGGVGKTTLLLHMLQQLRSTHSFSFVAFVELFRVDSEDPALPNEDQRIRLAQASLLMQLGGGRGGGDLPVRKSKSSSVQLALKERIRDLAANGLSFCIAIDNVWRAQDLEKLLSGVLYSNPSTAAASSSCIIITSRVRSIADDLEDVCARIDPRIPFESMVHEHKPLQHSAAKDLLLSQLSRIKGTLDDGHEKFVDKICTYCAGIFSLLKVAGNLLACTQLPKWESTCNWILERGDFRRQSSDNFRSEKDEAHHRRDSQLWGIFETSYKKLQKSSQEAFRDIASVLHGWPWDTVQTIVGVEAMKELTNLHLIQSPQDKRLASEFIISHGGERHTVVVHEVIRQRARRQRSVSTSATMDVKDWLSEAKAGERELRDRLKYLKYLRLNVVKLITKGDTALRRFSLMQRLTVLEVYGKFHWGMFSPTLVLPKSLLYLKLAGNELPKTLSNLQLPSSLRCFELEQHKELLQLPPSIYACKDLQILRIMACPVLHGFWLTSNWHFLRALHLETCDGITQLPQDLEHLELLTLRKCVGLKALPRLPSKQLACIDIYLCRNLSASAPGCKEAIPNYVNAKEHQLYRPEESPIHLCRNVQKLSATAVQLKLRNCTCRNLNGLGFVEEMTRLRKMKLDSCSNLVRLPNSICKLKDLMMLDLRGCSALEQLPLQLESLRALETLALHDCVKLKRLPDNMAGLTSLKELSLIGCTRLEEVPEEVGSLRSLRVLRLAKCQDLTGLPDSICNLQLLSRLDLHGCEKIQCLPEKIGNLGALETLLLMGCHSISVLPVSICELSSLYVLSMNGCTHLKALPPKMGNLSKLTMLNLAKCSTLTNLCNTVCDLRQLMVLDLQYCLSLEGLPEGFGSDLPVLETVLLKECQELISLPESFCELKSLKKLDLSGCLMLKQLPDKFGELSSLVKLGLADCEVMKELPSSICQLSSLVTLDLQGCYMLEKLPEKMGMLNALQELNLVRCRRLGKLPLKSVGDLKSLKELDMRGSQVEKELIHAKGQLYFVGDKSIRSFFEYMLSLYEKGTLIK